MKAFYPRTIEKNHSSGIENAESLDPCIASYLAWENNIWVILTNHRCIRSLPCLKTASQRARTGQRRSTRPSETKSPGPVQCSVQRRMFLKVVEIPLKFLLFFHSFISSFVLFLPSFLLFNLLAKRDVAIEPTVPPLLHR